MRVFPIRKQRKDIAEASLDPSRSATYVALMALAYMRDYTTPAEAIAADAAIIAVKKELVTLEKYEKAMMLPKKENKK
jgi:hypothetical protein